MIDYQKISSAISFYSQNNFEYIDVPWVVDKDVVLITTAEKNIVNSDFGCLVGSAEQSFLHIMKNEGLKKGKYVSCTPCFRQEDKTYFNRQYFIKVELIDTISYPCKESLLSMIDICLSFYSVYVNCSVIKTDIGYDIVSDNNVELGSYGIRTFKDIGSWIYGTGLAEPRLSCVHRLREI